MRRDAPAAESEEPDLDTRKRGPVKDMEKKIAWITLVSSMLSLLFFSILHLFPGSMTGEFAQIVASGKDVVFDFVSLIIASASVTVLLQKKQKPLPEACARCGFDLTGRAGPCPQCGEMRRLPKLLQK